MIGKYASFAQLRKAQREGLDYSIICERRESPVCIVAPHAGKIEFQTGELARDIAGQSYGLYLFEGHLPQNNRHLHITSTNFDEPKAIALLKQYDFILGLHGRRDFAVINGKSVPDPRTIFLGGLDTIFVAQLAAQLHKAGFVTRDHGHLFLATDPRNICNQGKTGKGAQIELPAALRNEFCRDLALRAKFVRAVQTAVALCPT